MESVGALQANGLVVGGAGTARLPVRTSLDLELDLQAFHTRLTCMRDEISRLHQLKQQLEEAKKRGNPLQVLFLAHKNQPFQPELEGDFVCAAVFIAIDWLSQS